MTPLIATVVYAIAILGLFWLDRDRNSRVSSALWIPVAWMFLAGSRMVSQWLLTTPLDDTPTQYLEGSPLDRLILAGLLAVAIIVLLNRRRQVGALLPANGPILLFFAYCAISIFWSDYPEIAFKRWTKALGDLVMVLVALTEADPSVALKRLLARTGFLLIPISVLLIKYYPDVGRAYIRWSWTPVYTGATTNKNFLGMICVIFGLASLWRFLQAIRSPGSSRRSGLLIAHGTVLAMVLWLFWMANSLTSLSCFVMGAGLITISYMSPLARKPAFVHLLVAAMLSVAFSVLFLNIGTSLVENLGRDSTLTGRTELWKQVLGMSANPFVGAGFESFWLGQTLDKLWSKYWWHPNEAHNGYLEVYLNLGWMWIALLALLLVKGYRNVVNNVRRVPDVGSLGLAYFVVAVAYNFTEAGFRMFNPVWIGLLLAITAVPQASVIEAPDVDERVGSDQRYQEMSAAGTHIYEEVI